ncbi:MAG TPA: hypothetical protein VGY58_08145 [Gemmataceae bacterium]|nr:hypothetical protein [Gemmataceae bacterium]
MWQHLASRATDAAERRRLLITAFRHTETPRAAREIRKQLEMLG